MATRKLVLAFTVVCAMGRSTLGARLSRLQSPG